MDLQHGVHHLAFQPSGQDCLQPVLIGIFDLTLAAEGLEPPEDANASRDYRRHLARVLVRRALEEAGVDG
jgi:hypothetical protein